MFTSSTTKMCRHKHCRHVVRVPDRIKRLQTTMHKMHNTDVCKCKLDPQKGICMPCCTYHIEFLFFWNMSKIKLTRRVREKKSYNHWYFTMIVMNMGKTIWTACRRAVPWEKCPCRICGYRRPWSACACAQADLGLRYPFTALPVITDYMNG